MNSSMSDLLFSGSIVALVTPFVDDQEQSVNMDLIPKLVEFHANAGTAALVPCGTTGESPTLSHAEHNRFVQEVVTATKGTDLKVLVGTGSNSTKEAIALTSSAAEAGADGCLIVCPYYNKPTPAGLLGHFRELDRIGIPLVVYNIPGRTGINISPDTLEMISNECKNIAGLKASNGNLDEITETAKRLGQDSNYAILSGDDSLTLPILSVGGAGVISVAANLMPSVMAQLVSVYREQRDTKKAALIAQTIHKLCVSLLRLGSNPAPVKSLMNLAGLEVGGCRLPLAALRDEETQQLVCMVRDVVGDFRGCGISFDATLEQIADQ